MGAFLLLASDIRIGADGPLLVGNDRSKPIFFREPMPNQASMGF
jgi:hypothetical protein